MNLKYAKVNEATLEVVEILETDNVEDLFDGNPTGVIWKKVDDSVPVGAIYKDGEFVLPFDMMKSEKIEEVKRWTRGKITGGFVSDCAGSSVRYDSDEETQITMQGIALNAGSIALHYPQGIPVRGYEGDNDFKTIFMLDGEQVLKWQADLSLHIGLCKREGWAKQDEVRACTTEEELNRIVLE